MADKPILIFPAPTVAVRAKLPRDSRPPGPRPTQAQQKKRLASRFKALEQRFGSIQADVGGIDPEQVIVFETVGSITKFQNAVKKIPGIEWLADFDTEIAEPDPGFLADGTDAQEVSGRLFVIVSNRAAYRELLKLWRKWDKAKDEKLPHGFGPLAEVFKYLHDIRPWGPKDRVAATGVVEFWERGIAAQQATIRFEAELWCRGDAVKRDEAFGRLSAIVNQAGGQCIKRATIAEIDYDGVLLELPAEFVKQAIDALQADQPTTLLRLGGVKYFAPMGQACVTAIGEGAASLPPEKPLPTGDPVVALLDGLPLTNHAYLQDRLSLDDPDGFATDYEDGEHRHGTAMASLIVHGEREANEAALSSKLYVRPLMHPGDADIDGRREERFPPDDLAVDLVHRAVKRLFDEEDGHPPVAPTVKVINLSVGDAAHLFDRHLSPWARLLDWLSWHYQVLFVVSAGNHLNDLSIPSPPGSITQMSDDDLRCHTIRAMAHQRVERRLLSPAESVNALTIGALHDQVKTVHNAGRLVDLLRGAALPSPVSSVASGFRRAIKPEILVPGGTRYYSPKMQTDADASAEFEIVNAAAQPGQLVASPGGTAVPPTHAVHVSGTSNAAALTTRRAAQFIGRIEELRNEPGGEILTDHRTAVIVKAMLVHGASWGEAYELINRVLDGPDYGLKRWRRIKRACAQLFGYGIADFERGAVCTNQRVIMLGCADLNADEGHDYQVPLPPALSAQPVSRRLAITLAWLTPVNPRHRNYCVSDLWFDPPKTSLQVKRTDVDHDAVRRGTVQHEVLEGDKIVAITEGDALSIRVNCRADAGVKLPAPIPYALMVSLETARGLSVSVYEQVRIALDRIRAATRVRPKVRAGRGRR